jgi:trehalose transport system substrate-binding protein
MNLRRLLKIHLSLFCLTVLLFATACKTEKGEAKVLKVSFSLGEAEWEVFRKKILPQFEKENNCKVEAVQVEAGDLPKLLEAGKMAKKSSVDLFAQDNMQLAVLVKKGLIEDLSDLEEDMPSEVYQSMINAGKFDDKLLFVPFRPNVQIFYYNKAKFDKYGLKAPKTWDEWLAVAKTFKDKEKIGRVLIKGFGGAVTVTQMYEYIVSAGGDPFAFNDDGCVKTFNFFKELWKYSSPDSKKAKWDTSNDYLARDSVYIMQNWPFGYNIITEKYKKKNIEVYSGIKGPKTEAHVIGGDVFGIPVGSENKELAVEFIKYMISKDVQSIFVSDLSWPVIREDAYAAVQDSPALNAVKGALKNGIFRKNVPYWTEFQKFFEEAFISIVINGKDTKSTLDTYSDKMKKVMQKY